jgi:large repetitive protein
VPDVPGDPTPPVVTPVIFGTLGTNGWYTTSVTVNWDVTDPESVILSTNGCEARTLTADTTGLQLTCSAESDGGTSTISKTFKLDKTAPDVTATPSRTADVNGWYNHDLSVGFGGGDATSGLESCSASETYSGPDSGGTSLSGTCRDQAGNVAQVSFPFKYDETAPQASPALRAPDTNGWYNHAVTVGFQGTDGTSGVDSCSEITYSGPDDPSVAISGTCVDRAGNPSNAALATLKYDETAPQASVGLSRNADANGWYNHPLSVSFSGSDAMSGLDSCDAPKTYAGPDSATASVAGACRDLAGNVTPQSVALRYDATAPQTTTVPSRQPNANGWYNAALSVSFSATDATSGNASCSTTQSYSGPDNASATVAGTCTDNAGNTANASFALKYDATSPQASATPSRQPNANGWFNAALSVSFAGTDATSGIDSCDPAKSYAGPDAAAVSLSGSCRDRAGNESAVSAYGFKYDGTAPQATATPSRSANASGWFTAPLSVSFTGTDGLSGLDSCDAAKSYAGPDRTTTTVTGQCVDRAGNPGTASFALKYDATPPQASATPSRQPNANGWYNAPLTVAFSGTDATSGIESCDAAKSFSGPDNALNAVAGTCRDKAGNAAGASLPVAYDATAPQATATPSRQPNGNGWYNAAFAVSFAGTDATSGIDACDAPKSYSGPDTSGGTVDGSCRDRAGNTGTRSLGIKYDATAPQVTASPGRPADANGWYNAPVTVALAGTDAMSGLDACDASASYRGPDSASASIGGTCRDKAGNAGSGSFALKYDATPPQVTATPSRAPNANGWYRSSLSVTFAGTDALSGLASCPQPQSYAGPDTASAVVSGTCLDNAGNGALASLPVKYDATAPAATPTPSRPPDANGWYNAPLAVGFAGTDATAGIESCDQPKIFAGPDTSSASLSGSCHDRAGNTSPVSTLSLRYDATAPQVTDALAVRQPDRFDWYNRPVSFAVQGTDATAGIDSCPAATYAGPDSGTASVTGTCVDKAGNQGSRAFPLKYDGTGPDTRAAPSRAPDANGWYRSGLTVSFAGEDAVSGLDSCATPETYDGPDNAGAVVGGVCLDRAGNVGIASLDLHYDSTPPQVTGVTPERAPDAAGWYNRPVRVSFQGSDVTSGLDACSKASYAGPDATAAAVWGSCHDRAGNQSAAASFPLRYDATAPTLNAVRVKPGNGTVAVSWSASPDTAIVELRRSGRLVYRGSDSRYTDTGLENGVRYRYTLRGFDEAGNTASAAAVARPTSPLFAPAAGAKVSGPPRLAWAAVPKATYYNVQVWRRGRILSAWPKRPSFQLKRTWTNEGRRYRLAPGRYRWYVWPGYGRPAEKRFGRLLGKSSFVVAARTR